ncbi:MAG: Gfo/Idh/MocA family protein, partial [Bacillota bacterium]
NSRKEWHIPVERKIKVGIIGAGSIAHAAHFPSFSSFEDVEIAAVLDENYERAKSACQKFNVKKAVRNIDEFLKQDLDAAVLLTPKTVRGEYLIPLLDAKLDVLVEKPLASTMRECDYLADVSAKSGQIVMVAFNRRYSTVNQIGIKEFESKPPHFVLASKSREFKEYRATLENAIHMVDMLRYILGECTEVTAKAKWTDPFYEDLCTASLVFENGSLALLGASREAGQWYERIEMFGDNKTVIMESPDRVTIIRPEYEEVRNMTPLNKGWSNYLDTIGFRGCTRHFIDCVKSRTKPLTSAEDAYKTMELMNRILQSAGLPDLTEEWGK